VNNLASIFRYIALVEEVRTYVEDAQAAQSDAQTPPTADRKAG
jgi:hypothetical protein